MILETLLTATIETTLGLFAEVGLSDSLRDLKDRWLKTDERKRHGAFEAAYQEAKSSIKDENVMPLLEHHPFQEAIVNSLLDSVESPFNVKDAAAEWLAKYPEHARPLANFFKVLERELTANDVWGPLLERFALLREDAAAKEQLEAKQVDASPAKIVREVTRLINRGTGAVAAQGGVAAGAGGIAVGGSVNQITHIDTQVIIKQLILQSNVAPPSADLRQRYLTHLLRQCRRLPLSEIGGDAERRPVTLDEVYIALNTERKLSESVLKKIQAGEIAELPRDEQGKWMMERGETEMPGERKQKEKMLPLTAFDALRLTPRLALLGDPGAGKSTFAKALIASMCANDESIRWLGGALPVYIELRKLAPKLSAINLQLPADDQEKLLIAQVRAQLQEDLPELPGFADELFRALTDGNCALVLDGLDEVAADLRPHVRQTVIALTQRYSLQRLLVTCRVRSYSADLLPHFESFTLQPFNDNQIAHFASRWYAAQLGETEEAKRKGQSLTQGAREPHTRQLASNPLLLTVMAIIHTQDVELPKQRVRLYKRAVEILLEKWQRHKAGEESIATIIEPRRLRPAMERLAYEAHRLMKDGDGAADLPQHVAQNVLEDFFGGDVLKARKFLLYVDQRAGLLQGRGGDVNRPETYTFPHRTFQEYLAGAHLLARSERSRIDEFAARAAEGDPWYLPAQFAMEELLFNYESDGERQLLFLAYNLLPRVPADPRAQRLILWSGQMAALAGRKVIERDTLPMGGENYLARLRPMLERILSGELSPVERADAGNALAKLGDTRDEVLKVDAMKLCFVPQGPFMMGSNEGDEPESLILLPESPRHEVNLPDYFIGLYPITNAQYEEFVQASGYTSERYWAEAKQANVWAGSKVKAWNDDAPRDRADDFGAPFNLPNHPVVGVTWYEALAFTRWLNDMWKGKLPKGWEVRLPTEAEWEKAARGGAQIPQQPYVVSISQGVAATTVHLQANPNSSRRYTWGDEFERNFANIDEAKIEATSSVGCFAKGKSPCGAQEIIGNVWEWCQTKSKNYPYQVDEREIVDASNDSRVVRGGSFGSSRGYARCACRDYDHPDFRSGGFGFRVVVSAHLSRT